MFPPVEFRLELIEECASTNEVLLGRRGQAGFHGSALLALRQTAGYGRRGRDWFTGEGNLALSLAFEFHGDPAPLPLLPFVAGLALFRATQPLLPATADLRLKWPNDLYLDGKKLSGLIAQARQGPALTEVVLGIGLNLREPPPGLEDSATALASYREAPQPTDFARQLIRELELVLVDAQDFAWIREAWESAACLTESELCIVGEEGVVCPEELLPTGELLVREANGNRRRLASETTSLRFTPGS